MFGLVLKQGRNGNLDLETSSSRVVEITLGEGEWEEELSMAAMRQFW